MQRHFSNRGEALAETSAAKIREIPSNAADQSTKRELKDPWPKGKLAAGDSPSIAKPMSTKAAPAGGRVKTHTLEVRARSLPELFEKAARALVALDGRPSHSEWFIRRTIELDAPDRETLLANWLDAVLLREQKLHELYDQFVIKEVRGNRLLAQLYGRKSKKHLTPIKKVTLFSLTEHPANGLEATLAVDVRLVE